MMEDCDRELSQNPPPIGVHLEINWDEFQYVRPALRRSQINCMLAFFVYSRAV